MKAARITVFELNAKSAEFLEKLWQEVAGTDKDSDGQISLDEWVAAANVSLFFILYCIISFFFFCFLFLFIYNFVFSLFYFRKSYIVIFFPLYF